MIDIILTLVVLIMLVITILFIIVRTELQLSDIHSKLVEIEETLHSIDDGVHKERV